MRYVTYEWQTCEESGIEGFWPAEVDIPLGFTPVQGLGLAHDFLEHQNGFRGMGSFEDEVEALGAILFVRGAWKATNRLGLGNPCIFNGVAVELENLWMHRQWLDSRICRAPQLGALDVDTALEVFSDRVLTDGLYQKLARRYMLRGYNKAFQRFGGDQWAINDQFFNLVDAVDQRIKGGVEESDQFRLAWSLDHFDFYRVEEGRETWA